MKTKSPIINILTAKLPYDLSNQIFNEYQSRIKEINYFIENYDYFHRIKEDIKTAEMILALSIFHKRVISNLDAAIKFYNTVNKKSGSEVIKMGSYDLTHIERNEMLAVTINYRKLIDRYSLPRNLFDYYDTKEFLRNLISFKKDLQYAAKSKKSKDKNSSQETLPF